MQSNSVIWYGLGAIAAVGIGIGILAALGGIIPTPNLDPALGFSITTIVLLVIAIGIFAVSLGISARKTTGTRLGATELSGLSKLAGWFTSLLVAYLPIALIWLGPILGVFLQDVSFVFPSFLAVIPFFTISTLDRLLTGPNPFANYSTADVLNKITSP